MNFPRVGVGVLIKNNAGEILLGKRRGSHGSNHWAPPGGHLEFGETIHECARREVAEETGLVIHDISALTFTNDIFKNEKKHYITIFVTAKFSEEAPQKLKI